VTDPQPAYDAVIVVSFGGPEGMDDVLPFLENVLRRRNVPRERMLEVAEHYYDFGGVSPINEQNRALIAALVNELNQHGPQLPVYWGNRNWHPLLPDAVRQMAEDGVRRALAFVTSAYSSYSSCRQYLENIAAARQVVGPEAPQIDKLRAFYNHPGFIEPMTQRAREALEEIPAERRGAATFLYTAHSIPASMAASSRYESQLRETCQLVARGLAREPWQLVYQSRSGPPTQPWLEPNISDALRALKKDGASDAVVVPIGFISDHMEVVYDLDAEAQEVCHEIGLNMVRARTVGTHPAFVSMIRELIAERTQGAPPRWLGDQGPSQDICPADCCR
jgi:ferrochelatase